MSHMKYPAAAGYSIALNPIPILGAPAGASAGHAAVAGAASGHDGSAGGAGGGVAHVVHGLHGVGGVIDAAVFCLKRRRRSSGFAEG